MPFTPTHMLAGLPIAAIWRGPGIASAIIIGTMVADWPLYIPVGPAYELTHSFVGILTACLPLGLALVLLFQWVLKKPLYELLPLGFRLRLGDLAAQELSLTVGRVAALLLGIAFGAVTHIVWDAFTHGGSWGVAMHPELRHVWVTVGGIKFPGYMTLQHASSLVGLPLMLLLLAFWYRRADVGIDLARVISPLGRLVWLLTILGVPFVIIGMHVWDSGGTSLRPVVRGLYYGLTSGGFAFCLLVLGYTGFYYLVARQRTSRHMDMDLNLQLQIVSILTSVAHSDGSMDSEEQVRIVEIVRGHMGITAVTALDLVARASADHPDLGVSMDSCRELRGRLNSDQKDEVILMILEVISADGEKDAREMEALHNVVAALGVSDKRMSRLYDTYFSRRRGARRSAKT